MSCSSTTVAANGFLWMVVSSFLAVFIRAVDSEFVVIALARASLKESALDDHGRRTLVEKTWKQLDILSWPVSGLYIRELR